MNTNLNTSSVRLIYISTRLELGCSTDCVCGSLTSALETQSASSVAIRLQTSHTAEMLPTHCKRQRGQSSVQVPHSLTEAP